MVLKDRAHSQIFSHKILNRNRDLNKIHQTHSLRIRPLQPTNFNSTANKTNPSKIPMFSLRTNLKNPSPVLSLLNKPNKTSQMPSFLDQPNKLKLKPTFSPNQLPLQTLSPLNKQPIIHPTSQIPNQCTKP
jgi:hypothetical protein